MRNRNRIITSHGDFNIIKTTNFLKAVKALRDKRCDLIYGPQGGLLVLNDNDCLVYEASKKPIYFSVECYLGGWRWLLSTDKTKDKVISVVNLPSQFTLNDKKVKALSMLFRR